MDHNQRFADTGSALSDLATHFIVQCPKCDGKSIIKKHKEHWRLTCIVCHHVEYPGHWYGSMTAYASVKCRECHQPIRRSASSTGEWKKIKLKCDNCGDECEYETALFKESINKGLMTDPVFGLPLWLQRNFRNDLFWAYNYDHLDMLGEYIGAKLRERGIDPKNTIRKNSSMISRLPEFISKAGNRVELLKVVRELQQK